MGRDASLPCSSRTCPPGPWQPSAVGELVGLRPFFPPPHSWHSLAEVGSPPPTPESFQTLAFKEPLLAL